MNKRYIYIIAIIVVLIALCTCEQVMVSNFLNNMQIKVESITQNVENLTDISTPNMYDKVVDLENSWERYESVLCYIVNTTQIEDVGIEITKLKVYVIENSILDFKASLATILYYLDSYHDILGISMKNVF